MFPTQMQAPRIKVVSEAITSLIQYLNAGTIRIPGFQRDYVWEFARIQKLIDSMLKEYPIGTFFLWQAPAEYNGLLRDSPTLNQPPLNHQLQYEFLLDGQQRLTSLYVTFTGKQIEDDDYGEIVVDLMAAEDAETLVSRRKHKSDGKRWVSVPDLVAFNPPEFVGRLPQELQQRYYRYRNTLYTYPCSVVRVSSMKLDDAIEIFERINRQGRRLDRFDLVSASVFTPEFDLRERSRVDLLAEVNEEFGEVASGSVVQTLALNATGRADVVNQMSLTAADIQPIWAATTRNYRAAVRLMRKHFGVPASDLLPYDAMLPTLAYYFHTIKADEPRPQDVSHLERWFWLTAFNERYSGTTNTRQSEDAAWIRSMVNEGAEFPQALTLDLDQLVATRVTASTAIRNAALCILLRQKPLNFESGLALGLDLSDFRGFKAGDHHQLFGRKFFGKGDRDIYQVPNFCFMTPNAAKALHGSKPSIYFENLKGQYSDAQIFENVAASHLLPVGDDSPLWSDDYANFARERARLLLAVIYQTANLSQKITESNPVVNAIETGIRDEIDKVLLARAGADYLTTAIPPNIRETIQREIDAKARHNMAPVLLPTSRRYLDFAKPSHYWDIVRASNGAFAGHPFANAETHFKDFQTYRNTIAHNNPVDSYVSARGLAACIWFARTLKLNLGQYGVF